MDVVSVGIAILASFSASFALTWLIRRYALRENMLDRPNERSLHKAATPTGGGLAIVFIMVTALLISLPWTTDHWTRLVLSLLALIVLLAVAGWMDDRVGLRPLFRFGAQLLATFQFLAVAGFIEVIQLGSLSLPLGPLAAVISALWLLWLANGYNFMDGIDGIAASQASIVACTIGVWFTLAGAPMMALFCYVIMAAALGFLVWNWSPAQIFMGDVASVTLGAVFAALAVIGNIENDMPLGAFLILMSVFVADTTITLAKRVVRGEVIWQAHRQHYYQRAVSAGWSHAQVTAAIIFLTLTMSVLATLEVLQAGSAVWRYLLVIMLLIAAGTVVVRREKRPSRAVK